MTEFKPLASPVPARFLLLLLALPLLLTSCGIYSFSGINVGAAKNIRVANFYNNAAGGPPAMGQVFTEKMREYYQQNTRLGVVTTEADLSVEGNITGFALSPVAPTADQQSAQTRLTITVQVRFTNNLDDTQSFDQAFTQYLDFPEGRTLSSVENELVDDILDRIVFDVFNKSVANW